MVFGSGGTARAAIFALKSLGFSTIFVAARTAKNVDILVSEFPSEYNLRAVTTTEPIAPNPSVIISTIPGDKPMDQSLREILNAVLEKPTVQESSRLLLEMAYKPRLTQAMQLAEDAGTWTTIPGLEVLASQGWYQVRILHPLFVGIKSV